MYVLELESVTLSWLVCQAWFTESRNSLVSVALFSVCNICLWCSPSAREECCADAGVKFL